VLQDWAWFTRACAPTLSADLCRCLIGAKPFTEISEERTWLNSRKLDGRFDFDTGAPEPASEGKTCLEEWFLFVWIFWEN